MFYGQNRQQTRQVFFDAWQKHLTKQAVEPLESLIIKIIQLHPEYHAMLCNPESYSDKDYLPEMGESNPFLHLGMHVAIQEQIQTDQPAGILAHYQSLSAKYNDSHKTEHQIMECLTKVLWEAQRNNTLPDNNNYLNCIKNIK
ncbi:MAG: DUF1841 family protein [Gammaproteobacteria bacterium]|nr:DUF1841 family protein [Gammaproteobacteria bacterium]